MEYLGRVDTWRAACDKAGEMYDNGLCTHTNQLHCSEFSRDQIYGGGPIIPDMHDALSGICNAMYPAVTEIHLFTYDVETSLGRAKMLVMVYVRQGDIFSPESA